MPMKAPNKVRYHFSILKAAEGGPGLQVVLQALIAAGVPSVRREHSPYVGHVGFSVPFRYRNKAKKLLGW